MAFYCGIEMLVRELVNFSDWIYANSRDKTWGEMSVVTQKWNCLQDEDNDDGDGEDAGRAVALWDKQMFP